MQQVKTGITGNVVANLHQTLRADLAYIYFGRLEMKLVTMVHVYLLYSGYGPCKNKELSHSSLIWADNIISYHKFGQLNRSNFKSKTKTGN